VFGDGACLKRDGEQEALGARAAQLALDRRGIELEAELTAEYGTIDLAPAYEDLVRGASS